MSETFGEQLRQFARAVDIVSESVLADVVKLVHRYAQEALHMDVCVLFIRQQAERQPGLASFWNSKGYPWNQPLRDDDGRPKGQVSYAYNYGKPMWIVSREGGLLNSPTVEYRDCFQNEETEALPPYAAMDDQPIRTSVYLPLVLSSFDQTARFVRPISDVMGVLNLESGEYIEPSEAIKREVIALAEALSLTYKMTESHSVQSRGTDQAKEQLTAQLEESIDQLRRCPLTGKRRLFVASSDSAPDDVLGEARTLLQRYDDAIEVYYWKQDSSTGNIHTRLWEQIQSCQAGIFYLSEPAPPGASYRYQDNPNVLFEAGMMHAMLGDERGHSPLVILREADSSDIPFDIVSQRRLKVLRESSGALNEEAFRSALNSMLAQVLGVGPRMAART